MLDSSLVVDILQSDHSEGPLKVLVNNMVYCVYICELLLLAVVAIVTRAI